MFKSNSLTAFALIASLFVSGQGFTASHPGQSHQWQTVKSIIDAREKQSSPKMRLTMAQGGKLEAFLSSLTPDQLPQLQALQKSMPKTTTELLMAIVARGLEPSEAEKMAAYLQKVPTQFHVKDVAAFDENTSHIIGREWDEIDYSGEGMTWQAQEKKYEAYGIDDFNSLENLEKFFPVESRMPYFYETYGYRK